MVKSFLLSESWFHQVNKLGRLNDIQEKGFGKSDKQDYASENI